MDKYRYKAKTKDVEHIGILALYGNNLLEAGEYIKAADVFRLLAKRDPEDMRWHLGHSYCLLCTRDERSARYALQDLDKLTRIDQHVKDLLRMRLKFITGKTVPT